ncbi:MAG: MFS transporter, partial [Clostridia bacterium]|nr:MFS transporter [Clostridia bacterium]
RILSYYFDDSGYAKGNLAVSYACHGATILIYLIVPFGIKVADWRFSFFFGALLAAAVLIVWCAGYWRLVSKMDKTAEREGTTPPSSAPLFKTLAVSGVLLVLVAIALQGYLKDGIQSWLPTFFTEVFEMDSSKAILMNMVVPVSSIIFVSLATVLFRKVFKNEVAESIFLFSVTTALSLLVSVFYTKSPAVTLVLSALIIGCAHGVNTMLISFLPRRFERIGKAATVGGICNAFVYVGSAASSYGIALIATNVGWAATLISWGIIAFAGIVVCIIALPRWKKYIKT